MEDTTRLTINQMVTHSVTNQKSFRVGRRYKEREGRRLNTNGQTDGPRLYVPKNVSTSLSPKTSLISTE
ncbi:hypothetical protein M8J77_014162 [Diaphorina citri]|nr:hypothetical protein M8J77_014162 [Diaphorina citri]